MRSTVLTVGDRILHLRYPFGVIEDIDQMLPEGFLSVFEMEAEIPVCHLLLWAGLRGDGVSYEAAGHYLIAENAVYDPIMLIGFWKKIVDALTLDKWITIQAKTTGQPDRLLKEIIAELEAFALAEFNLTPDEFYGLTPREFELYKENSGLQENRRTGTICATMANIHAPKKGGTTWKASDFMHTGEQVKEQTPDEQQAAIMEGFGL